MNEKFSRFRTPISPQLSFLFVSSSLLLIPGLADISSSSSTNEKGSENDKSSRSSTKLIILILCLGLIAAVASVFLYKLWQKKKREEQHARLLKLFEQDDDLEVELGLRD